MEAIAPPSNLLSPPPIKHNQTHSNTSSSSPSSSLNLPRDCYAQILSFLSLKGCLTYGSTCKSSLFDIESDLLRRKQTIRSSTFIQTNVCRLCESLPYNHFLLKDVQDLFSLLNTTTSITSDSSTNNVTTQLQHLHNLLQIQILHASILTQSLSGSSLDAHTYSITTPLSRYVGDVLLASFLMPNTYIIEGGPSEFRWISSLVFDVRNNRTSEAMAWYRIWILLHSSVLRCVPFSFYQRRALLLGSWNEEEEQQQQRKSLAPSYRTEIRPRLNHTLKVLRDVYQACSPKFTFQQFGILGPTFRGRDRIRSMEVMTSVVCTSLMEVLKEEEDGMLLLLWDEGRIGRNMEWLFQVHGEVMKRRPMTVKEPVVTFVTSV